ncbi:hypothetical protein IF129_01040 [Streptomyces chumphonensis]|uniref:Secreted protein n=1 Tax=Streptomyces chumphonensis TaxID=1214925 RepID=A0A927EV40_9ACTN|nr:hypothetical protein [Streptomyces chumphonensis]MBD3930160.1 hypothetical protein [Streptomyces chumphonensis]
MKRSAQRKLVLIIGVAGAVATVVALRVGQSPDPTPAPPGDTSTSEVREHPSDVEEYWTEERMRDADPAPMPEEN